MTTDPAAVASPPAAMTWEAYEERYGETEAEHRCPDCGGWWWATCGCAAPLDAECGASRFADCPLPLGHPGICEERT